MATKQILKDRKGEVIYPITDIACVNNAPNVDYEEYVGDVEEVTGVTREELKKDLFIDLINAMATRASSGSVYIKRWINYNPDTGYLNFMV